MAPRTLVRPSSAAATAAILLASLPSVLGFSFSYSAPTQCGALTLNWTGGTAPFSVLITPAYDVPRNISIPAGAFTNGQGSYTISPFPIVSQKQFLLTMSDGTGFGSGGTSDLLTVADPVGGATCDTTVPSVAFDFQLNTALQQCRPYAISNFNLATQPVTIYGLIPLGSSFVLNPPAGSTSYSWTANAKSGTRIVLTITDGQGRSGGSSDLLIVGASDDSSCINANSPASTITSQPSSAAASASKTHAASRSGSSATTSATAAPDNSGKSSKGGIIAGAIIGVVVLVLLIGSLIWFLMRRHRKKTDSPHVSTQFRKRRSLMPIDSIPNEPSTTHETGRHYEAEPYVLPASTIATSTQAPSEGGYYPPGRPESESADGNRYVPAGAASSSHTSKYSEAFSGRGGPPNTPARFVLHTDAGEIPEAEEEVVELPPQYTSLTAATVNRAPTYRERGGQNSSTSGNPPLEHGQQQQPPRGGYPTGPSS
ncbi:hypothetical protein FRC04_003031 [Tulasnella sp. 424]|nr:hypothetical protein FRC04_003031 [Tulasnella sp. 424]KAG8981172.1 hypothetical protein FRC05_004073 [Tulasnella sp. 425]